MMKRIVYSSDHGRTCPDCGEPIADCTCRRRDSTPTGDGVVRVCRETKGRRGKAVTVITGVPLAAGALKDFAKRLKQKCGSGGTVKDGTIEIQGDHRNVVEEELRRQGWTVKRSGAV